MKPNDELSPPFFGGLFFFSTTEFPMRTRITLPKPIGIHPYFDKIQFWVCEPLDLNTLALLKRSCGPGGVHIDSRPARFNNRHRQYRQRIELRQPSQRALRWLARRNDALINRAEITLDLVFKYRADVEEALDFLHQHLVRRWHGKNQEIRVFRSLPCGDDVGSLESRYDAGRWASNALVLYRENHSRVTGELNCVHIEWRVKGLRATRAAGIESGQDLLEFDHRAFWQEQLLLYTVDRLRLDRYLRNHLTDERRTTPGIRQLGRYRYNAEGKIGEACARSCETVQELIHKFKSSFRIHRALIRMPNVSLLPEQANVE
jgi:hypothetical protein